MATPLNPVLYIDGSYGPIYSLSGSFRIVVFCIQCLTLCGTISLWGWYIYANVFKNHALRGWIYLGLMINILSQIFYPLSSLLNWGPFAQWVNYALIFANIHCHLILNIQILNIFSVLNPMLTKSRILVLQISVAAAGFLLFGGYIVRLNWLGVLAPVWVVNYMSLGFSAYLVGASIMDTLQASFVAWLLYGYFKERRDTIRILAKNKKGGDPAKADLARQEGEFQKAKKRIIEFLYLVLGMSTVDWSSIILYAVSSNFPLDRSTVDMLASIQIFVHCLGISLYFCELRIITFPNRKSRISILVKSDAGARSKVGGIGKKIKNGLLDISERLKGKGKVQKKGSESLERKFTAKVNAAFAESKFDTKMVVAERGADRGSDMITEAARGEGGRGGGPPPCLPDSGNVLLEEEQEQDE